MTTLKTKPVSRTVAIRRPSSAYKDALVVTIYPGGILGLRERGRRQDSEIRLDLGELYVGALAKRARP